MPTAFLLLWTALSTTLDGFFLLFPRTFIRRVAGGAARTVCRMFVFGMIPTQILVEPFFIMCFMGLSTFAQTSCNCSADSIQTYFEQARMLKAGAYMKLAVCYHEGKGVEHNLPMVLAMLKGAEKYGEGLSTEKFFASLDAEDADRKTYEEFIKLETSGIEDFDVVMGIAKRGGELMEKMIQVAWLQRNGKVEEAVTLMAELAERIPACYAKLGDYYKERDREKALEYYRLADKWACLNSEGTEMLLEEEYKKEQQTHQIDKYELNRLRLIKDGIGG